jgi:hypothetical protein
VGAKSVTEKTTWEVCASACFGSAQQPSLSNQEGAAKIQRSPQQSVLPVSIALQGRWIFDARVKMESKFNQVKFKALIKNQHQRGMDF